MLGIQLGKFAAIYLAASHTFPSLLAQSDTIPFTLTEHNNIMVEAILNETDTLQLMFHTDAADIGLTPDATARSTSMVPTDPVEAISWGSTDNTATYSRNRHLQIGARGWDSLTVWTDSPSGHGTDGKFGPTLFEDKVIEINFNANRMVIHSSLSAIPDGFTKAPIRFDDGSMYLEGDLDVDGVTYRHSFLIHSGYSATILNDDQFARKHGLTSKLTITSESELSDSYGNTMKTKKAVAPRFVLGIHSFTEMPVGFFEGHLGGEHRSVLGGELLKRFNMVLDLQKQELYLRPSGAFGTAFKE